MKLNHGINNIKAKVRLSHLTKNPSDFGTFHDVLLFGIQSISGKILTFHGMTDYGMLRSRIPLDQLFLFEPKADIPAHFKMLWDCFDENVTVLSYDYLYEKRCEVVLRDGTKKWCTYLFTVDWYRNPYSDEPTDYKCGHVLVADEGYLLCQPNNRIFWKDSNWITKKFPVDPKTIKVDNILRSVETVSDRWVTEDTSCFYYDQRETKE